MCVFVSEEIKKLMSFFEFPPNLNLKEINC